MRLACPASVQLRRWTRRGYYRLIDGQLEVYREPAPNPAARYAYAYRSRLILRAGDVVSPLARPESEIAVADLLP